MQATRCRPLCIGVDTGFDGHEHGGNPTARVHSWGGNNSEAVFCGGNDIEHRHRHPDYPTEIALSQQHKAEIPVGRTDATRKINRVFCK